MNQRIMYKVLARQSDGRLTSCSYGMAPDSIVLEYTMDKLIKPKIKNSKLFIFETFYRASTFFNTRRGTREIWKVVANNPSRLDHRIDLRLEKEFFMNFWANYRLRRRPLSSVFNTPVGSWGCDSLWLAEKIQ